VDNQENLFLKIVPDSGIKELFFQEDVPTGRAA